MNNKTFLIEIGTEEMPSKLIIEIAKTFYNNFKLKLNKYKIKYSDINIFHSPRRIAISINKFNTCVLQEKIQHKGPSIKNSFNHLGELTIPALKWLKKFQINIKNTKKLINKKGEWLLYEEKKKKNNIKKILTKIITSSINNLKTYRTMIWNQKKIKFIRPIRNITILLDNKSINQNILEINSTRYIYGNIATIPSKIKVYHAKEYEKILYEQGKVIVDFEKRKQKIHDYSHKIAKQLKGKLNINNQFLEEATCLVEWPVILYGKFKKKFLNIPNDILIYIIESIQKYFPIYTLTNQLTNYFIIISNTISNTISNIKNNIILGNERVLHARLSDIIFFLNNDKKKSLKEYFPFLKNIIFHEKLGSMHKKTIRLIQLIQYTIQYTQAHQKDSIRAAYLSKCDLKTQMVYEFPELQGSVGMHYAIHDKESKNVSIALKEQYMPRFSKDQIPSNIVGYSLSITDKIDTIVGLFLIHEEPKKNKDPFGLRRLAIGVIRIIIKYKININLYEMINQSIKTYNKLNENKNIKKEIIQFILNRLYIWYKEKKYNTQIIQSVFSCNSKYPVEIHKKIKALHKFQNEISFKNLILTKKRINNLIKKINIKITKNQKISLKLMKKTEENTLFQEIKNIKKVLYPLIQQRKYEESLHELFKLYPFVKNFLDNVSIKSDNEEIKLNRIALLTKVNELFLKISDF